jgi:hypothetical protein
MLDQLTFSGRELLVFVVLSVVFATVVYLLETLLFAPRRKPVAQAEIEGLRAEVAALSARIEALEARPPAESALDTQASTHAEAQRLAREGLPAAELAAVLGISRSEAELIVALQQAEP